MNAPTNPRDFMLARLDTLEARLRKSDSLHCAGICAEWAARIGAGEQAFLFERAVADMEAYAEREDAIRAASRAEITLTKRLTAANGGRSLCSNWMK